MTASCWDRVVGQPEAVAELAASADAAHSGLGASTAMTHAWLITGPPGSGRSVAAESFAAALVCDRAGCGECSECRDVLAGTHPDVDLIRSTALSYGKQQARELVVSAAGAPVRSRWRCFVMEDSDRLTEAAANTLLKALEEPHPTTVWVLCAPSSQDVLPTILSRCRHVGLRIPAPRAVAKQLEGEGAEAAVAGFAAAASHGHIGRARALAFDPKARSRRTAVLRIPARLHGLEDAYAIALELKNAADADAKQRLDSLDEAEREEMVDAYGQGAKGVSQRRVRTLARTALADLGRRQQLRSSRGTRDELDRHLVDLLGFYRDVLVVQQRADQPLINADVRPTIEQAAALGGPTATVARMEAIGAARAQLEGNVPPQVVCEALMVRLVHPIVSSPLSRLS